MASDGVQQDDGSAPVTPESAAHDPVMIDRVLALLAPALQPEPVPTGAPHQQRVVLDATLGLGGHAEALLRAHPDVLLIGVDRDPVALQRSAERLAPYAGRLRLVHAVYDRMAEQLLALGLPRLDGVLFDLGVSSMQLDVAERGFAYAKDGPLDMRMDTTAALRAEDVVNDYPVAELARVIARYGEERFARRVAAHIDRARRRSRLVSTAELAEIVRDAVPAAARRTGGHPAKRTFQALRIEVNGELDALEVALPAAVDALGVGGRIVVLSYHSLEDRVVKQTLRNRSQDRTPPGMPVVLPEHGPELRLLTRGAETPDEAELLANPRSSSVRLRAAQRIRAAA